MGRSIFGEFLTQQWWFKAMERKGSKGKEDRGLTLASVSIAALMFGEHNDWML